MIKALVAAFGLRSTAKKRLVGKAAQRWSGVWALLLVLDIIRLVRRRRRRVIARRILKDGEVLVISNSSNREHQ
ncbi:MAG: hypothetical protein ACYC06_04235 [Ilumatobacteraceae bacterium]